MGIDACDDCGKIRPPDYLNSKCEKCSVAVAKHTAADFGDIAFERPSINDLPPALLRALLDNCSGNEPQFECSECGEFVFGHDTSPFFPGCCDMCAVPADNISREIWEAVDEFRARLWSLWRSHCEAKSKSEWEELYGSPSA